MNVKRAGLGLLLVLLLLGISSAPGRRAISVAVLDLTRGGTVGGDLTVAGDAGVANNFRVGGDLEVVDDMSADDGLFATASFSGGGTPCLQRGGNTTVQTCSGDGFASLGSLQGQGTFDVWDSVKNTANGSSCSGNTAAVCINDPGGFAVANAGTTTATITAAGAATFTNVTGSQSEWALPAVVSLGSVGSGVVLSQAVTSKAGTYKSAAFVSQAAGIGAGNFVLKLCSDGATCAGGNTFTTCTAACTSVAGTVTTCTAGSATTYTAAATLSWSISTSCATDTIGNATAILANN